MFQDAIPLCAAQCWPNTPSAACFSSASQQDSSLASLFKRTNTVEGRYNNGTIWTRGRERKWSGDGTRILWKANRATPSKQFHDYYLLCVHGGMGFSIGLNSAIMSTIDHQKKRKNFKRMFSMAKNIAQINKWISRKFIQRKQFTRKSKKLNLNIYYTELGQKRGKVIGRLFLFCYVTFWWATNYRWHLISKVTLF